MKKLLIVAALAVTAGVVSANTTTTPATTPAASGATKPAATTPATTTANPTTTAMNTFTGQITHLTPTSVSIKTAAGAEKTFTLGTLKADASWTVGAKITAQYNPTTNQLTKVDPAP